MEQYKLIYPNFSKTKILILPNFTRIGLSHVSRREAFLHNKFRSMFCQKTRVHILPKTVILFWTKFTLVTINIYHVLIIKIYDLGCLHFMFAIKRLQVPAFQSRVRIRFVYFNHVNHQGYQPCRSTLLTSPLVLFHACNIIATKFNTFKRMNFSGTQHSA